MDRPRAVGVVRRAGGVWLAARRASRRCEPPGAAAMHDGATPGRGRGAGAVHAGQRARQRALPRRAAAAPGQAPGVDLLRHAHHVAARSAAGAAAADARVELFGAAGHARADRRRTSSATALIVRDVPRLRIRRRAPADPRARLGCATFRPHRVRPGRWRAADAGGVAGAERAVSAASHGTLPTRWRADAALAARATRGGCRC